METPGSNGTPTGDVGGRTLAELRTELLIRLGYASQLAFIPAGVVLEANSFLQDAQRQQYMRYPALRTERWWEIPLTTLTRFYVPTGYGTGALATALNYRKLTWAGIEDENGAWHPISQGIPPAAFTVESPGLPTHFEIREQVEVWPPPDRAATLWIKGHFGLTRFSEDTDTTTIDDDLVFLFALANAKAHRGHPDAGNYATMATSLLRSLVAGSHGLQRYLPRPSTLGMHGGDGPWPLPVGTWRV